MTPFWVIGCLMYEAHFKKGPWQTHLNPKCVREFIKKYPVAFPRSIAVKYEPALYDCIMLLTEKDPSFRLGSEA